MGWEQLGGRRGEERRKYALRPDGKQSGREQDAVNRNGRLGEKRPRPKRGWEVTVGNEMHSGFPLPSQPVADPTTFPRPNHYRAYPCKNVTKVTPLLLSPWSRVRRDLDVCSRVHYRRALALFHQSVDTGEISEPCGSVSTREINVFAPVFSAF